MLNDDIICCKWLSILQTCDYPVHVLNLQVHLNFPIKISASKLTWNLLQTGFFYFKYEGVKSDSLTTPSNSKTFKRGQPLAPEFRKRAIQMRTGTVDSGAELIELTAWAVMEVWKWKVCFSTLSPVLSHPQREELVEGTVSEVLRGCACRWHPKHTGKKSRLWTDNYRL